MARRSSWELHRRSTYYHHRFNPSHLWLKSSASHPTAKPVEVKINDWGGKEGDELGKEQPSHNGDTQRAAQLGPGAILQRQGKRAKQSGHCGHHDGAKTQEAGLLNGLLRSQAFFALGIQGKINHHNRVL